MENQNTVQLSLAGFIRLYEIEKELNILNQGIKAQAIRIYNKGGLIEIINPDEGTKELVGVIDEKEKKIDELINMNKHYMEIKSKWWFKLFA